MQNRGLFVCPKIIIGRCRIPIRRAGSDSAARCAISTMSDEIYRLAITSVIARSVSDVAISSSEVTPCTRQIDIENLKSTMLIGATCVAILVMEIATARWASQ